MSIKTINHEQKLITMKVTNADGDEISYGAVYEIHKKYSAKSTVMK